jgi:SAM-dependent methyltransferase
MTSLSPVSSKCPSCQNDRVRPFYEYPSAPANSVLLLSTRKQALEFPTGDVSLGFCVDCGFIYNTSFDRRLVEYSSRCEESQGYSSFFRSWHEGLARRLIERYSLHGKRIIEIGCGKGEFLALLCDLGNNQGFGFDPAYVPDRIATEAARRINFVPDFYSERYNQLGSDFVCCKMTLEHIAETARFIRMVRRSLQQSRDVVVFFQVPDVWRILEERAFWDIYYEHCSYFSFGSLARLFSNSGFEVLEVGSEYQGQYLTIEARAANDDTAPSDGYDDRSALGALVETFATQVPKRIAEWRLRLEAYRAKGLKTVVWGAGSKGVTFLSVVNVPGAIAYVVDINPNMWGHYMAKTGLEIVNPAVLQDYRPDVVIVMNAVYREEIVAEVKSLGLGPEVISA